MDIVTSREFSGIFVEDIVATGKFYDCRCFLNIFLKQLAKIMTLTDHHRYATKTRSELIEEIILLNKELVTKKSEIAILKKKLAIYESLK